MLTSSNQRVGVFKTDVQNKDEANFLIALLQTELPNCRINFDLEDCDNILRIEGGQFDNKYIETNLYNLGFQCSEL